MKIYNSLLLVMAVFQVVLSQNAEPKKIPIPKTYKELQTELNTNGKVILYDIQFENNKAKLLSNSEPQIKEISRLLNAYKKIKVYIVVHTDNTLELDKALELSQEQAEAIRNELGDNYLVNIFQIIPKGVGPLSPLTSNTFEEGKKINRRVELVLQ